MRHFLNLSDAGADGVAAMLADAIDRKAARAGFPKGRADAVGSGVGEIQEMAGHIILPGTGRGTALAERGGGGASTSAALRGDPPPPCFTWSPSPYRGGIFQSSAAGT